MFKKKKNGDNAVLLRERAFVGLCVKKKKKKKCHVSVLSSANGHGKKIQMITQGTCTFLSLNNEDFNVFVTSITAVNFTAPLCAIGVDRHAVSSPPPNFSVVPF